MNESLFASRDPRVPFCKGGAATCEICVGSCGIEEYEECSGSLFPPEEIERLLRKEWWVNHGHDYATLYGDDGEMACNACPADFKRMPLDVLHGFVMVGRAARARAAMEEAGLL